MVVAKACLSHILDNDALTRGLGDAEARVLIEWLVDRLEAYGHPGRSEAALDGEVRRLCRWARGVVRFVTLWCYERRRGAAVQLAAAERFFWPLPTHANADPCELMLNILAWEVANQRLHQHSGP
jgi:hypothetical protein